MPSTPSTLPTDCRVDRSAYLAPLLVGAITFFATYGVELFSFGLSIDEEAATYVTDNVTSALGQGRWGISLILLMTPSIGAIPLVSTALFGVGLLFATWRAFWDFELRRRQAFIFAAVHVAFPVWLHVVQFNTLAGSLGIGLAAGVVGSRLATQPSFSKRAAAALFIAFAISVYQTLALYCAVYVVFVLQATFARNHRTALPMFLREHVIGAVGTVLAGAIAYVIIQKVGLAVFHVQIAYVDGFFQVDRLFREPANALHAIFEYVWLLLGGGHSAYLGWGVALLLLSWAGLLPLALLRRDAERRRELRTWAAVLVATAAGILLLAVPTLMSVATLPLRAYVTLPLLAAWLASRVTFPERSKLDYAQLGLLAYFVLVASAIASRLFYSDQVVHAADAALTQQLIREIDRTGSRSNPNGSISFSLVGAHRFNVSGQLMRAEQFGASFYEQDGGNVYRVSYLMRLQGSDAMQPVWLSQRPDLVPAAMAMPIWPADGSVRLVNGVVLVKVGPPTLEQLSAH